jgi:alpha-ketoglutarate-dependent taurine dioxygenase
MIATNPRPLQAETVGLLESAEGRTLHSVAAGQVLEWLRTYGVLVLRGFGNDQDVARQLTERLGRIVKTIEVTGTRYVGYHGELTYTPFPPDLLCFHCSSTAAGEGGETTFCDGILALEAFSAPLRRFLETNRLLMQSSWSGAFLRRRFEIDSIERLREHLSSLPGLSWTEQRDDAWNLSYLTSPIVRTRFQGAPAFVNSLLIALHDNRPRPERAYTLTLEDGRAFPAAAVEEILEVTKRHTYPLRWQVGDYAVVDNSRLLHGRHPCADVDSTERKLVNMHTVLSKSEEVAA